MLISGHDGGTGASPLTSIKHAGCPVGARPGGDPAGAGAERPARPHPRRDRRPAEDRARRRRSRRCSGRRSSASPARRWSASGCIMMRVCHLNTCPVGIATQDPELRKKFAGKPEHVVNFMMFMAREVREIMAELGFRTHRRDGRPGRPARRRRCQSITGRRAASISRASCCKPGGRVPRSRRTVCESAGPRPGQGTRQPAHRRWRRRRSRAPQPVEIEMPIRNVNRTVGTMLSAEISRRWGEAGLPAGDDLDQSARLGGAELRRLSGAGDRGASREGMPTTTSARACRAAAWWSCRRRRRPSCRRRTSSSATSPSTGRPAGEVFLRGMARRALRRAQQRRRRGRRRRRRSRLRVHDARHGGRARRHRAQLRRRDERRGRVRPRRRRRLSRRTATPAW